MEFKKIKCPSCGGELKISEDSDEMKCGYCGSNVIIDDKATEIGRIKKAEIKVKKELDEHELENKKKNDTYNDEREYNKKKSTGKLKGWAIALTIICLLFTFTTFNDGKILSGLIGIIQIAAFGYATLLCLDVLPEKIKNLHKIVFIAGCVLIVPFVSLSNVSIKSNSYKEEIENIVWSEYNLSDMLPEPKTLKGVLKYDTSSSLSLDIVGVDKNEYKQYVNACKDKGFIIDINNYSNSFSAKNDEGYDLFLNYNEDDEKYSISLSKYNNEQSNESTDSNKNDNDDNKSSDNESNDNESTTTSTGLRSEFKNAMDSYEAFIDEYVDLVKNYNSDPTNMTLLSKYTSYLEKYSKYSDDFDKWNDNDLNNEELKYYMEVQSRTIKKLSEIQ